MYDELFAPIKIGALELPNRFVMPAMDSHYTTQEHRFSEQALNYYGERAKGGFGLLVTEYMCVSEEGLSHGTQAGIYDDRFIPSLSRLADRVHKQGGRIFAQLQHSGRKQGGGCTPLQPVGASAAPERGSGRIVHELSSGEVADVVDSFAEAARRAKSAGFDGVEVHAAHGYLLAQFLSLKTNHRADKYGGCETDRARIVCEIIRAIKARCGEDFPVSVRLSAVEDGADGNGVESARTFALLFENAGADVLNVSCDPAIKSYYYRPGFNLENTKAIKDALHIPVIGIGRINDPSVASAALLSGCCDMVALGRQSICDSHFPEKTRSGRLAEIFTCTGCLQRCLYSDRFEAGFGTSCMINPFSGKEGQWAVTPAERPKRIAVVGAGPAGLQAAWILAKRRHDVTVFEKETRAGGQYRLAAAPPMKNGLGKTISTYLALGERYGVKMIYGTSADASLLRGGNYDEIIIAAGAVPIKPPIPGIDGENVCTAAEVLRYEKRFSDKRVLVLGAGLVGAETAELLGEFGNSVTIVDMIDSVAPAAPPRPREDLCSRLAAQKMTPKLGYKVLRILENGVTAQKDGVLEEISGFDAVVLAFGSRADRRLYDECAEFGDRVHLIGDCAMAGDAKKAIFEATELALKL